MAFALKSAPDCQRLTDHYLFLQQEKSVLENAIGADLALNPWHSLFDTRRIYERLNRANDDLSKVNEQLRSSLTKLIACQRAISDK